MSIELENGPLAGRITVHFSLAAADHPNPVSVVGSFNEWTPGTDLMIDHGDGTIGANVAVDPGTDVVFRYLGTDGHWFDEPEADEMTTAGCLLHIPTESVAAEEEETTGEVTTAQAKR